MKRGIFLFCIFFPIISNSQQIVTKVKTSLFTDGLHPKSAGYDKLGEKLEAVLKNN
jgi:lysophospholipase L1-like esterase